MLFGGFTTGTKCLGRILVRNLSLYSGRNRYLVKRVMPVSNPLVWIDCEMTGLNHHTDRIIEVCCIVTDGDLEIVQDNCYESVIHYDESVMDSMNEWCIEHHGASGLTKKVLESDKSREQVEQELLEFIKKYVPDPRVGLLAGNSVHMDRLFMLKEFPKVIDHLFYRLVDVSSIMEVCSRHNPALARLAPRKKQTHTAKSDILESIEQLRWYRTHYLKSAQETADFVKERTAEQSQEKRANSPDSTDATVEGPELKKSRKL
ncbi:hypothetical protein HG537_0B06610 [Torulaspora globosa]|uniref:Exonuclease domain-containing protein n=1 Tax=Torulaspora globosa TaxID=48254 RepID=A0A7H9HPL3_9SACH|nr:hypothetical protein HG537_0B06610 [Torulaspora sp. CBS 2947]